MDNYERESRRHLERMTKKGIINIFFKGWKKKFNGMSKQEIIDMLIDMNNKGRAIQSNTQPNKAAQRAKGFLAGFLGFLVGYHLSGSD
jgi:hypothetical protein